MGNRLITDWLKPLDDLLAGRLLDHKPDEPPRCVTGTMLRELDDYTFLALAAMAPLLDQIFRGWDRDKEKYQSEMIKLKLRIGDDVCKRFRTTVKSAPKRFDVKKRMKVGHWLFKQAMRLDIFDPDFNLDDKPPRISDKHLDDVASLREWMLATNPSFAPSLRPPTPWTKWSKTVDGFEVTFVRDRSGQTEAAIEAAFNQGFEHAKGVNALAQVALKTDPVMVELVARFGPEVMGHKGRRLRADKATIAADVTDAKWVGDRVFWLDYSCDKRGRVYPLQNLNFTRGDHVRAMLRFARGLPINGETRWLEIHCANCAGKDKLSRTERLTWVGEHREDIERIAKDPVGTFDKWKDADKPFQFVAACLELVLAWADPQGFITHLPISFDGSANGLQHLALLSGDHKSMDLTNLWKAGDNDRPKDIYAHVIAATIELIDMDHCDHAQWWREMFKKLDEKDKRKLLKQPIMTFAYNVTDYGACRQIAEAYYDLPFTNEKPPKGVFMYLARLDRQACKQELLGPKRVQDYIRRLAKYCLKHGRFPRWVSATGFPVENRYYTPNTKTVYCMTGSVRVRHNVADGVTDQMNRKKVLSAAAPNFVHALDAAHLIKTVNAAVREGITNIATVHDCFFCLAPQAAQLHSIIPTELDGMYKNNQLEELLTSNVSGPIPEELALPPRGTLLNFKHGNRTVAQHLMSPAEGVKEAKNSF
jgi:DNA-directed RNA polymerase